MLLDASTTAKKTSPRARLREERVEAQRILSATEPRSQPTRELLEPGERERIEAAMRALDRRRRQARTTARSRSASTTSTTSRATSPAAAWTRASAGARRPDVERRRSARPRTPRASSRTLGAAHEEE